MAPKTKEEMEREILAIQLETAQINLEQAKENNAIFMAKKDNTRRQREQAQMTARATEAKAAQLQKVCKHRQGVAPDDIYGEGTGKSCLTRSNIFFSWNWLIQCVWCGLRNQTPHPSRRSKKLLPGETQEMMQARVKKYEEDLAEHKRLLAEAKGNGLPPMVGPQWKFENEDGMEVVPAIR